MVFDDDLNACAGLVQRGDPDRFLAAMAAPVTARPVLFALYAFNVEVARAPWVTQEAMIAEMRLQWWRDALIEISGKSLVRRHEVVSPLARLIAPDMAEQLDQAVAVRRWDIYKDPFEDVDHFDNYIDQTSGTLMWAAAHSLGAADEDVVRDYAWATGLANWLRAIPGLEAQKRIPLLDGTREGVQELAQRGLDRLDRARKSRHGVSPQARPALLSGWQTRAILKQASAEPDRVVQGSLGQSEARKRLGLMMQAATGRW